MVKFVTNASGVIWWPKFAINASGATWWPNLDSMQVAFYLAGEITQVIDSIRWNVAKCVHEVGQNQITPFWIQVMFSVFRGPKYDDIRPNHTKKSKNAQKNAKTQKNTNFHYIALQCTVVKRLNYSPQMGQIWPIMTQDDWLWLRMTYQGSGEHQGAQGGTRGQ